jgi:hypothetical protein
MIERDNPHELETVHGGLFISLWNLMRAKDRISQTIWGDQGFMQILGGVALSRNPNGEPVHEDIAVAYGLIGGNVICDIHLFRETPDEGRVVERVFGFKNTVTPVTPLEPLSFPISYNPKNKLRIREIQQLTAKLDEYTEYSEANSSVAAQILQKFGVYTDYSLEDVSTQAYKECGDNPEQYS